MSEESLSLPEVQEAFRQAQSEFLRLAKATEDFGGVSSQLRDASGQVSSAAHDLAELARSNGEVAGRLAAATEAIERIDPAAIDAKLTDLASQTQELRATLVAETARIRELQDEGVRRQSSGLRLTLIALMLVIVGIATLVVLNLG